MDSDRLSDLCSLTYNHDNISIRTVDVSDMLNDAELLIENRPGFSTAAFYRLLIPWLMPDCEKIIYLDGDVLVRRDLADLYHIDLGSFLLGAAADACSQESFYNPNAEDKQYRTDYLKMREPEKYFNAGVMIINQKAFQNHFIMDQILEAAYSGHYKYHDQDVLNSFCSGQTYILFPRWNAMEVIWSRYYMPSDILRQHQDSLEHPYLVHFVSKYKAWPEPRMKYADEFWMLARDTLFMRNWYIC